MIKKLEYSSDIDLKNISPISNAKEVDLVKVIAKTNEIIDKLNKKK